MKKEINSKKDSETKEETNDKTTEKKKKREILKKLRTNEIEQFIQSLPRTEKKSPSLEKVNFEDKGINLEKSLANVKTTRKEKEEGGFNYSGKKEKEDEPKYQHYNSQFVGQYSLRENLENLEKKEFVQEREVGFVKLPEEITRKNLESDYINVERFERDKLGEEDFSKKKDVKYEVKF